MAAPLPLFVKCPGCGEIIELQQPDEWECAGWFQPWTDGRHFVGWRLRNFSDDLFRGYSCGQLFWQSSAEKVGNPWHEHSSHSKSKYVPPPFCNYMNSEPYHLAAAIEQGMCLETPQELHVRMRLWWSFNNPFRPLLNPKHYEDHILILAATIEHPESFVLNARRLIELLQPSNPRELILTAELHRQLGDFDVTISLLSGAADLFDAVHESEREQSRLFQAETRAQVGDDPIWDCSARSEDLAAMARRIMDLALTKDKLVRPVEQKLNRYEEAKPTNAGPARGMEYLFGQLGIDSG